MAKKKTIWTGGTKVFAGAGSRAFSKPLAMEAVDKILQSVGLRFVPADVDRAELAKELGACLFWHNYFSGITSRKRLSNRRKFLSKLVRQSKSLRDLLATIQAKAMFNGELRGIADSVERLSLLATEKLRMVPIRPNLDLTKSPVEWLAGEHMPTIYQKYIRRKAGSSRDPEMLHIAGPYVRFVLSTLDALDVRAPSGASYSAETVIRALRVARSSKNRRNSTA